MKIPHTKIVRAALLEAEDVRARAGLGVAEADESASLADVLQPPPLLGPAA